MSYNDIDRLIFLLSKIPGLGPRSARRAVLHMLENKEHAMLPLLTAMQTVASTVRICNNCGNLDIISPCTLCCDRQRDKSTICVVESVADLWAMERGKVFRGSYHVLGGTLSATENRTPANINLDKLVRRVSNDNVIEVILATNSTVDGQTTAYYITDLLKNDKVKISRLASGIPIGGELDYLDEGTLSVALKARQPF